MWGQNTRGQLGSSGESGPADQAPHTGRYLKFEWGWESFSTGKKDVLSYETLAFLLKQEANHVNVFSLGSGMRL